MNEKELTRAAVRLPFQSLSKQSPPRWRALPTFRLHERPGGNYSPESAGAAQILAAAVHWNSGPVDPDFATTKAQKSGQAKQSEPTVIGFALYWTCLVDSRGLRIIGISGSSGWILLSYS